MTQFFPVKPEELNETGELCEDRTPPQDDTGDLPRAAWTLQTLLSKPYAPAHTYQTH